MFSSSTEVTLSEMTRLSDAVYVRDLVNGTGAVVARGNRIRVYTRGQLSSGFTFEAVLPPSAPAQVTLDTAQVVTGFIRGVTGMRVGGTRRIVIGPAEAYLYEGLNDRQSRLLVPPNSVLVYTVEVTAVIQP
jgi:FKBP-type peptidyl-prolyl cis-trans isomerase